MAYTRTWNTAYENTPAGSDQRNTVDDRIREFKVDMRERMNAIVNDWTADPVTPKYITTGKVLYIAAADCMWTGASANVGVVGVSRASWGGVQATMSSSNQQVYAIHGLLLPTSARLTGLSMMAYAGASIGTTTASVGLYYYNYNTSTTEEPANVSATGSIVPSVFPTISWSGTYTLSADKIYIVRVQLRAPQFVTPTLFGVKITYDVTSAAGLR